MKTHNNILILTSETIWYQLTDPNHTLILSPQQWDIDFEDDTCIYRDRETGETGQSVIDAILFREGHIIPESGVEVILHRIKQSDIPTINDPEVTLLCIDDVKVRQLCLEHNLLQKYCKFRIYEAENVIFNIPGVIKLPNYHGGKAKWKIDNPQELKNLLEEEIRINWGEISHQGYLDKTPYISDYIVTEPFVTGRDLRVYTYLDRETDQYYFKYLERVVKDDQWMANVHTKSFELHSESDERIETICLAAVDLLKKPDLVGIDFLIDNDDITILEINNDVPGLASMQMQHDFTIHQQLLKNLNLLV